jgi:DNA primase
MSLTPEFLDELRARTLLSALVGRTLKITKAGREFKGCCPFHNEKTPSFYVNDEKGFYHCFGCGAHGDAIRWMTDQRGLPFMDAVKELAQTAGMEVPAPDPKAAERAERANSLYDVMTAAADWFVEQFQGLEGAEARGYCEQRGLKPATLKTFGIGFAPDSKTKLKAALARFGDDKLVEAGLLIAVDDKAPYDRFRNRLMIPIRDARGRVIAFGGRILGSGEPKYLNSPDTPLFDKGRTLYNLDLAGPAARKSGRLIAVEGYMDVVALSEAEFGETVAPLGTALTETQIARMWQLNDVPTLCFDGDRAGQKASFRAALRALPGLEQERSLRFAMLPQGLDPDDLIRRHGREQFEQVLQSAIPLHEFVWSNEVLASPLDTPEAAAGLKRRLFEHTLVIRDQDVRAEYQAVFNQRLAAMKYGADRVGGRFFSKALFTSPVSMASIKRIASLGIDQAVVVPAILAGFVAHCALISRHAEALAFIPVVERDLEATRQSMIEIALEHFPLDQGQLMSELKRRDHVKVLDRLRERPRPAFSFLDARQPKEKAEADLARVTEKVAGYTEVKVQIEQLRQRLTEHEKWSSAMFAEQDRLRHAENKGMDELKALLESADEAGEESLL